MVSAFLIGQFGKNFHESIENGIEGNETNRFRRCGEHISKTDGMRYVRMMRLF